jgi:hypothetical protein
MTSKILTTTLIVIMAMAILIAGCSDDSTSPQTAAGVENGILSTEDIKAALERMPVGEPSEEEIADLLFMREEEKLAHDVYTVMYDLYDLEIFTKIAASELKHTEAVLMLLDRFGQEDPVGDNGPGEFANEDLHTLYNDLIESGSQSLTDALLVGLAIEENDILDLEEAMARTELPSILMVYGNLLKGSHNHLRAFVRVYESQTGEVYVPRWLSQEAYDEILSSDQVRAGERAAEVAAVDDQESGIRKCPRILVRGFFL